MKPSLDEQDVQDRIAHTAALTRALEWPRLHSERMATKVYRLEVTAGPHQGESFPIDKEITHIGRASWCDICLSQDEKVSAHHCELLLTPSGLRLKDRDSRNGILLAEQRVLDVFLSPGAVFQLGETSLTLQSTQGPDKEIELQYYDDTRTLVGASQTMRRLFSILRKIAASDLPVLLEGETGTGKSTIAKAIHTQSGRSGAFVDVNCGNLNPNLIESRLFGHEKGAFTGADRRYIGEFEQADGGTLFLDEIGELPLEQQTRLLKVLDEKKFKRLGSDREVAVDFRLVTATLRDLKQDVKEGRFREDLYFRLAVLELEVPPLRQRPEDIPMLAQSILQSGHLSSHAGTRLSKEAIQAMQRYNWPGNVRELRNVLERALVFQEGRWLDADDLFLPSKDSELTQLSGRLQRPSVGGSSTGNESPTGDVVQELHRMIQERGMSLRDLMEELEAEVLRRSFEAHEWKIQEAANALGISKSWAYDRKKKYGLRKS